MKYIATATHEGGLKEEMSFYIDTPGEAAIVLMKVLIKVMKWSPRETTVHVTDLDGGSFYFTTNWLVAAFSAKAVDKYVI